MFLYHTVLCRAAVGVLTAALSLLRLRELLRNAAARPHQPRDASHHLPGAPRPAVQLPHAQQVAQQPGESCGGHKEQRGRLRPVGYESVLSDGVTVPSSWRHGGQSVSVLINAALSSDRDPLRHQQMNQSLARSLRPRLPEGLWPHRLLDHLHRRVRPTYAEEETGQAPNKKECVEVRGGSPFRQMTRRSRGEIKERQQQ